MAQTRLVKQYLTELYPEQDIALLPMVTKGDQWLTEPLYKTGGKALFLKELEYALLHGQADIAVHSLKDVPASLPDGFILGPICERQHPWDSMVFHSRHRHGQLELLPKGAVIGTSSLRRKAQLLAYRPDLNIQFVRGNINTRLKKLEEEPYDALVLASAGLERLHMHQYITMRLPEQIMLPAPGQGAIAIELRADNPELAELLAPLNHKETRQCVTAERLVQAGLGANCHTPVAAYALIHKIQNQHIMQLRAMVASEDGTQIVKAEASGSSAEYVALASQVLQQLTDMEADRLILPDLTE